MPDVRWPHTSGVSNKPIVVAGLLNKFLQEMFLEANTRD